MVLEISHPIVYVHAYSTAINAENDGAAQDAIRIPFSLTQFARSLTT
jgi:hypothetical protein